MEEYIENFNYLNALDLVLVSFLIWQVYKLVKNSVAKYILIGYLIVYLFYWFIKYIHLELLSSILGEFMRWGFLGLIIIFQQEIRRFLQNIGSSAYFRNNPLYKKIFNQIVKAQSPSTLQAVIEATKYMATVHTGAIIVIHRQQDLSRYIETGDELDSAVSKRLILSVFNKNSPLHDGAIIIQNDRIKAARCMLPVSESGTISPNLGFRHRAAIGLSEQSDAAIVVVSEENGEMSFIENGNLSTKLSLAELENKLIEYFDK